ncbi:hypothetical protein [Sphingomonas abietis]|uniref:Uncharacterized protein n=1 Tax=Sphingomonas abietis TaxID=3012344 RepID=A0ABY7NKH1_9SPHN|nr:hypothetical protein [Sphingomonas abietis]WBO21133.1 hypothetical protein PBT88_13100 [Sphingomonas abietis]
MSGAARRLLLLGAAAIGLASAADARRSAGPALGPITLDRAHPVVETTIAGVLATIGVALDDGLDVAPDLAGRLPVAWQPGPSEYIGRVVIPHRQANGEVAIAGVAVPMTIRTQDQPCCNGQSGTIGAIDLPWPIVRIGTGESSREHRYPALNDVQSGFHLEWKVGRQRIAILLAPDAPETVATAAAAAILSKAYGGRLGREARTLPIAYGVARPVWDMTLAQPATLLGFPLSHVAVRIVDYAGDSQLPDADQPPSPAPGKDDIVVRHRPLPPQFRWAAIAVGRDLLDRCPQISVYRETNEIGLVCQQP